MKKISAWSTLIYLLAAGWLFLNGCSTFKRAPAIPMEEQSVERIQTILAANLDRLDHLKARGRLLVETPEQSVTLDAHLLLDRPDTLYVRLEALFGMDVGWLLVVKKEYTFYSPLQNVYSRGSTDSLRLERFVNFDLDSGRLIAMLAGVEVAPGLEATSLKQDGKLIVMEGYSGTEIRKFWIDRGRGVIVRAEAYDSTNQMRWQALYERFTRIDGVQVPLTIRLKRPAEKQVLTMFYEKIEVNKKFSSKDFKTKIPKSARRITL